jgi:hypothetical protein
MHLRKRHVSVFVRRHLCVEEPQEQKLDILLYQLIIYTRPGKFEEGKVMVRTSSNA